MLRNVWRQALTGRNRSATGRVRFVPAVDAKQKYIFIFSRANAWGISSGSRLRRWGWQPHGAPAVFPACPLQYDGGKTERQAGSWPCPGSSRSGTDANSRAGPTTCLPLQRFGLSRGFYPIFIRSYIFFSQSLCTIQKFSSNLQGRKSKPHLSWKIKKA